MRQMRYLGVFMVMVILSLSTGSLAGAQENSGEDVIGGRITDPVGETPVGGGGGEPIGGRITDPIGETPVGGDQYGTIPEPQPSTPVPGPPYDVDGVTELPDTGGPSGLALLGGALLLGSGLVVRRIVRGSVR